jgi:Malectin domain
MFQRISPLAIPTFLRARAWRNGSTIGGSCLALMCAMWLVPLASVHAQTTVNYNFEDGVVRGIPSKMQVPPKIITENGNKFMRITGSAGDKGAIPAAATNRNRSLVELTPKPVNMPVITSENRRQTYSVDMRWTDPVPSNACSDVCKGRARVVTLQLYQHADGESESYGSHNGIGPAVRFLQYGDGRTAVEHLWNNENASERVPLGRPGNGWHNYKIVAEWQLNGGPGRLEIYYDGVLKKVWSGTNINLGPASNRLPTLSVGLYGDYAVGIVDVDNVKAGPSSGGGSTPPAPVPDAEVVAVNVGGAQYAGADGTVYRNDAWFSGGSTYTTTASIAGTTDDRLYQNDRFGNFSYNIPVANGDYLVTLKFAELYWTEVGRRVFNVSMEGKAVLSHLDLVAKVGPKARYDVTLPVTVTGGVLNIRFQSVVDDATISGIKVAPKSASVSAATNVRVVSGQ